MEPEKIEIEDLLLNESFINYCKQSSPEDIVYWENYLIMNPVHTELLQNAKESYFELFSALSITDLREQENRLNTSLDLSPATTPVIKIDNLKSRWGSFSGLRFKIAAAVILLMTAATLLYYYLPTSDNKNYKTFGAIYGERKNIQLPDGSFVTLNAGSSIKIKDNFGSGSRDVCLEGEAFFDVKHNPNLPFIVHTAAMDIKAVGTAFNVKAYKNDPVTETSLIQGIVEVTLKEQKKVKMLLYPNEKVKWENVAARNIDKHETVLKKLPVKNEPGSFGEKEKIVPSVDGVIKEIAWKENKLVFEDEDFDAIAILLERWYAVKINFKDSEVRKYRFTGMFEKEKLETVLEFLKESRNFNYFIEKGEPLIINLLK